jgi:C-terminal processing protease CtpA/Prc
MGYNRVIIYTNQTPLAPRKGFRSAPNARRQAIAWLVAIVLGSAACGSGATVGSVGAVLSRDSHTGALHVQEAPAGLAAASAGLIAGDQIKMIDGVLADELDASRIRALLRGPIGSKVTITVVRGDEVMHVEVARQEMGSKATVAERHERIEE